MRTGFPNCKIEIYNVADELTHTITSNILSCNTHDVLTSGVGSFNFALPALKGFTRTYSDIGNHYKAKFSFGYNSNYTHVFTGRIVPFTDNVSPKQKTRVFEGKGLGEILERNFIYNKRWQNEEASAIVTEIADLGLGYPTFADPDIDEDTTDETITVRTESYFDVLKKISDYWVDGDTKVQKDYGVDKDGTLFWKARPLRTVGVETFTYGKHFSTYSLKYDITNLKNSIQVFGAPRVPYPYSYDDWTDSLDLWTALTGSLVLVNNSPPGVKAGTYRVQVQGETSVGMKLTLPKRIHLRDITTLNFWYDQGYVYDPVTPTVYLYAPDSDNCFTAELIADPDWHFFKQDLGENNEYDADERPDAIWHKTGDPNWWDIQEIAFETTEDAGAFGFSVDKLWFYPERYVATSWDTTSINNYGEREAEYTDDQLLTADETLARARTLMYTQKDRVLRLDFTVPGNSNVLVGDRLTMTLPPSNVSAVAFDVASVDQHFTGGKAAKWQTSVHAIQGDTTRQLPSVTTWDTVKRQLHMNRDVNSEIYSRIVR
jgi:hypothetical protein